MDARPMRSLGAAPRQTATIPRVVRKPNIRTTPRERKSSNRPAQPARPASGIASAPVQGVRHLKGLIFDCDGVIVDSEDIHRRAYNAAFEAFEVVLDGKASPLVWDEEFYGDLQNRVGGGKPKMRWYFGRKGWPRSTLMGGPPGSEEERAKLVDTLQDFKSEKYREMIGSGSVAPRPGVLRLMDEARGEGLHVAVCSAATKESVIFTLKSLLGEGRFDGLDCFLAGDDVKNKKPDPEIYDIAARELKVLPSECLVIEDSAIGLQAALSAGMRCVVTYTESTKSQEFSGAEFVVADLDADPATTVERLQAAMSTS